MLPNLLRQQRRKSGQAAHVQFLPPYCQPRGRVWSVTLKDVPPQTRQVWEKEGLPAGSDGKGSACNAGDLGLIPGSGRSPGEGKGYPLQYSCLGKSHGLGSHPQQAQVISWRGTLKVIDTDYVNFWHKKQIWILKRNDQNSAC